MNTTFTTHTLYPKANAHHLYARLYFQLNQIAAHRLSKHFIATLHMDVSALVHESFMKIAENKMLIRDDQHLLAVSSIAMRHIILDHLRTTNAQKRNAITQSLDDQHEEIKQPHHPENEELEEALTILEKYNARWANVVRAKFFEGLTYPEIARKMQLSVATIKRDWLMAKNWLQQFMMTETV